MYKLDDYDAHRGSGFKIEHYGTITDIKGNTYSISPANIIENTGSINRSSTSSSGIAIGSVESSYMTVTFMNDVINRYLLYDTVHYGKIELSGYVLNSNGYLIDDDGNYILTDDGKRILYDTDEPVNFGEFNITQATRNMSQLTITAYDNMILLGKDIDTTDSSLKVSKTAYKWLTWMCDICGVSLGNTETEVINMANGSTVLNLDTTHCNDIKTYRDILSHLATALGGVAVIGRDGKLYIKQYIRSNFVTEYGAKDRYTSEVADFVSQYSGIYFTYATDKENTDEYYHTSDDKYLAYTVGVNAFLQIADTTARQQACQNVMDALANAVYVPFTISARCDPCIDVMDVIHLKDNQMTDYDISVVTQMTYNFGGKTTLTCVGKNPILDKAESKAEKIVSVISKKELQAADMTYVNEHIAEAAKSITGFKGGCIRLWNNSTSLPDNPNEFIVSKDSYDPSLSTGLWIWNAGGLGYTTKYGDTSSFKLALTPDGQINANAITTGMLISIAIKNGTPNSSGIYPFSVDSYGNLYASSATITGTIYANAGIIGGWDIGSKTITSNVVGSFFNLCSSPDANTPYLESGYVGAGRHVIMSVDYTGKLTATGAVINGSLTSVGTNNTIVLSEGVLTITRNGVTSTIETGEAGDLYIHSDGVMKLLATNGIEYYSNTSHSYKSLD